MSEQKTNSELANDLNTTSRQVSKSRKRGWITTNDGVRKKYTAPAPKFVIKSATGHNKKKKQVDFFFNQRYKEIVMKPFKIRKVSRYVVIDSRTGVARVVYATSQLDANKQYRNLVAESGNIITA